MKTFHKSWTECRVHQRLTRVIIMIDVVLKLINAWCDCSVHVFYTLCSIFCTQRRTRHCGFPSVTESLSFCDHLEAPMKTDRFRSFKFDSQPK